MIARLLALLLLLAPTAAGAQTWLTHVQSMACGGSQFARTLAVTGVWTCAQPAFSDLSGQIAPSQLVTPGASTLGGVKSSTGAANQFATGLDTTGALTYAQPSFANLSGSIAASQLIAPGASTLGGVKSSAGAANQFATGLDTTGALTYAQPSFANLSGQIAASQLIAPGASTFGAIKSSSAPSNQFATGVNTSGVVTYAQPAFSNLSGAVAVSQLPGVIASTIQTGTAYTLTQADCGSLVQFTNASPVLVTLPSALSTGCVVLIGQIGAGKVAFTQATGGASPANAHGFTTTFGQYAFATVINGVNGVASAWVLIGDAQ